MRWVIRTSMQRDSTWCELDSMTRCLVKGHCGEKQDKATQLDAINVPVFKTTRSITRGLLLWQICELD